MNASPSIPYDAIAVTNEKTQFRKFGLRAVNVYSTIRERGVRCALNGAQSAILGPIKNRLFSSFCIRKEKRLTPYGINLF